MNIKKLLLNELVASKEYVAQNTESLIPIVKNLSRNLISILQRVYNRNISESRSDFKALIMAGMLSAPDAFKKMPIDEDIKKRLVIGLNEQREFVKIKTKNKDKEKEAFRVACNDAVENVFSVNNLRRIIDADGTLKDAYEKIMLEISNVVGKEKIESQKFTFRNIKKAIGEKMSIFNVLRQLNVPDKATGKDTTYYIEHPNGAGRFPDYMIYLRDDSSGKELRDILNVRKDVDTINVESKMGRIVGKQTTKSVLIDNLGEEFFNRIFNIPVGKMQEISSEDFKKLMKSFDVEFRIPTVFVDVSKDSPVKVFRLDKTPKGDLKYKKTSPGQLSILKDGKKIFGVEIGGGIKDELLGNN